LTETVDIGGGRLKRAVFLVVVAAGVCGFTMVMVGTRLYGPAVTPDSLAYVSAARGLLSGRGMLLAHGRPFTMWAPLYAWILAAFGLTGADPYEISRVLNASCFAGIVTIPALWVLRESRHPVLALFTTLIALSYTTMARSAHALSEPLFIVLVLLTLWRMRTFVTKPSTTSLIVAGLLAGAACLTRYIGVSVVAAGGVLLLIGRDGKLHKRLGRCLVFGSVALLPLVLWLARNWALTGHLAGVRRPATATLFDNVTRLGQTLVGTLIPVGLARFIPGAVWAAGVFLVITGAVVLSVRHRRRRDGDWRSPQLMPPLVFLALYVGVLLTITTITMTDPIGFRLCSPVCMPILLVFVWSLDEMLTGTGTSPAWQRSRRWLVTAGVVLVVVGMVRPAVWMKGWLRDGAGGYNTRSWHRSETIAWLRAHRFDEPLYSNDSHVITFLTGKHARIGPQTPVDGSVETDLDSGIRRQLPDGGTAWLVWFKNAPKDVFYSPEQIARYTRVERVIRFSDGTVYLLRVDGASPPTPPEG